MKREDWDSWIARLHSLGSAEELYDSDMTHSYRLTEGRLIRYPLTHIRDIEVSCYNSMTRDCIDGLRRLWLQ